MKNKNKLVQKMTIELKRIKNLVVLKFLSAENIIFDTDNLISVWDSYIESYTHNYNEDKDDIKIWTKENLSKEVEIGFSGLLNELVCEKFNDEYIAEIVVHQILNTLNSHFDTNLKRSLDNNIYEFKK